MDNSKKRTIVFIVGMGHSGSTVLDKSLGNTGNGFSFGELVNLGRVIEMNNYCTCGKKIRECHFWTTINAGFQEKTGISFMENPDSIKLENPNKSVKDYVKMLIPFLRIRLSQENTFIKHTKQLVDSVFELSRADMLIDSSKDIMRVYLLKRHLTEYDVKIVHLFRKPLGVVNSYLKTEGKVKYPGQEAFSVYQREKLYRGTPKKLSGIIIKWIYKNLSISWFLFLYFKRHTYCIIEHETVMNNLTVYNKLLRFLKQPAISKIALHNKELHIVTGNASRFSKEISIQEKKKEKATLKRVLTNFFSYPLYLLYKWLSLK
jgi:hypothetical protein